MSGCSTATSIRLASLDVRFISFLIHSSWLRGLRFVIWSSNWPVLWWKIAFPSCVSLGLELHLPLLEVFVTTRTSFVQDTVVQSPCRLGHFSWYSVYIAGRMNEQWCKILGMAKDFPVRRSVYTGCGAQSASNSYAYLIGDKASGRGRGRGRGGSNLTAHVHLVLRLRTLHSAL